MSEPVKNIKGEIWFVDIEYVPCIRTGRRVLGLPDAMPDSEVLAAMYKAAGATENDPRPMLKSVMYRIVSIAAIIRKVNGEIKLNLFSRPLDDNFNEAAIIEGFLKGIGDRRPQIVGYATTSFDLPTIFQRAVINKIDACHFCHRPLKPWDNEPDYFSDRNDWNIDLMKVLGGYGRALPKLSEIALACGIPAKIGGDGADVAQMWLEGKGREIVNYNECDVLTTYLLWLQTVRTCGLMDNAQIAAEEQKLNALLEEHKAAKPHLGEFQRRWHELQGREVVSATNEESRAETNAETSDPVTATTGPGAPNLADTLKEIKDHTESTVNSSAAFQGMGGDSSAPPPPRTPIDERAAVNPNVATTLANLITAKQLGMIRAIARELRIQPDSECQSVMNCRADELSKKAASEFIKHLQDLQRPANTAAADQLPMRRAQ